MILRAIEPANIEITKEMRRGVMPEQVFNITAGAPTQMMLHGYCSDGQVWQGFNVSRLNILYFLT